MSSRRPHQILSHVTLLAGAGVLLASVSGCGSDDPSKESVTAQSDPASGSSVPTGMGATDMGAANAGAADMGAANAGAADTSAADTGAGTSGGTPPPGMAPGMSRPGAAESPGLMDPGETAGSGGSGGMSGTQGAGAVGPNVPAMAQGGEDSSSAGAEGADAAGGAGTAPEQAPSGNGEAQPSSGCGQDPPSSDRYSIDVDGLMREYILAVPDGYDPNTPYRLIFTWHPWGGSAQQVAGNGNNGYYGLKAASGGEAILVSPEGLDFGGNGLGWGNEGGQDIAFLEAMLDRFDAELCFDHSRTFSTGFSFGGMMSNAVGCAGLARAIAPMAGNASVSGCGNGDQPVAFMGFHGTEDSVVSFDSGAMARDNFVERNGCGAAAASDSNWCDLAGANFQPCECTSYEGCQDGYPVTWCAYNGNHMAAPNSGETIWNFFSQF